MREKPLEQAEKGRVGSGIYATPAGANYGGFEIPFNGKNLRVIVSDGAELQSGIRWEHVSVSRPSRCPTWEEMSFIKNLFWSEDETVVQFHPPKSDYINNHPYCLHLWKPPFQVELPPQWMTGIKDLNLK